MPGFVNAHSHAFHRCLRGRSGIGSSGADNFWKWRDNMYKLVEEADFEKIQTVFLQIDYIFINEKLIYPNLNLKMIENLNS
jgi:cytosine/adenosine deaminase-related metal-dependent hydrolase